MLLHLKTIMWILDVMKGNVQEAEKYAEKACHMRDHCPDSAEWCVEMAKKHLEFNNKGMSLLDKHLAALTDKADGEVVGAIKMYVHEKRSHLAEESVEVHVMLDKYKA